MGALRPRCERSQRRRAEARRDAGADAAADRAGSLTRAALEEGDALDVRSVREHVDHARRGKAEALGVDQDARIAGERRRVARDAVSYTHLTLPTSDLV